MLVLYYKVVHTVQQNSLENVQYVYNSSLEQLLSYYYCDQWPTSTPCLKKHLILFHNQEQEEGDEDIVFDECDLCYVCIQHSSIMLL